jgi:hypothetical protein
MKIRNLKWRDLPMWPPEWWISDHGSDEEGVLHEVQFRFERTPQCLYVGALHLGDIRKGIIVLDDPGHLKILYNKLKENVGKPLTEIGDLEIDFLQPFLKKGIKKVRPYDSLTSPGGY